jgi:uncharacterized membrane protein
MRIGVSSSGRWWISMGPLGWLLAGWVIVPVMAAWYLLIILIWLIVCICRATTAAARRSRGSRS